MFSPGRSVEEREIWSFLAVKFEDEPLTKLLNHLDFERPPPPPQPDIPVEEEGSGGVLEPPVLLPPLLTPAGEDFFDNLHGPATPREGEGGPTANGGGGGLDVQPPPVTGTAGENVALEEEEEEVEEGEEEEEEEEEEIDEETEALIERALVVGDYEGAVETCLRSRRMADALVIAGFGGQALWNQTQGAYMETVKRPYMKVGMGLGGWGGWGGGACWRSAFLGLDRKFFFCLGSGFMEVSIFRALGVTSFCNLGIFGGLG